MKKKSNPFVPSRLRDIPTLGPIGYLPAPGTMATIATLPLVVLMHRYGSHYDYAALCIWVFFFGIYIIGKTLPSFGNDRDPACIVIDEVAGCLITFAWIPISLPTLALGFILFRLFDIFKLGFIKKCEEFPGAWGIMVDDLVAGVLANLVMQLLLPFLV